MRPIASTQSLDPDNHHLPSRDSSDRLTCILSELFFTMTLRSLRGTHLDWSKDRQCFHPLLSDSVEAND